MALALESHNRRTLIGVRNPMASYPLPFHGYDFPNPPKGYWKDEQGNWHYSRQKFLRDSLNELVLFKNVTQAEVDACTTSLELQRLLTLTKARIGKQLRYQAMPKELACEALVAKNSPHQPVNAVGMWIGHTIAFTGQMSDPEGSPISRTQARLTANEAGFVWLESVVNGCSFLVSGDLALNQGGSHKLDRAFELGVTVIGPRDFWIMLSGGEDTP